MHHFHLVETSVLGERKLSRDAPIDILERNNSVVMEGCYDPLTELRIQPLGIELNGFHGGFLLVRLLDYYNLSTALMLHTLWNDNDWTWNSSTWK